MGELEDLAEELVRHANLVLIIVAAGFSMVSAACNTLISWPGPPRNGVHYTTSHCSGLREGLAERMLVQLDQVGLVEMISIAVDIPNRLVFPARGG